MWLLDVLATSWTESHTHSTYRLTRNPAHHYHVVAYPFGVAEEMGDPTAGASRKDGSSMDTRSVAYCKLLQEGERIVSGGLDEIVDGDEKEDR